MVMRFINSLVVKETKTMTKVARPDFAVSGAKYVPGSTPEN